MTSRSPAPLVLAAACAALLAGCAVQPGGSASPAPAQHAPAAAASAGAVDICSMFSPAEVTALIGAAPAGRAASTPAGGGTCTWTDEATQHSLTVEIGDPDTAINGTLRAWDPSMGPERALPGGMRDNNGAIEFVCGGTRECSVQVVKQITGDADQQAGIGLVDKIRAKLGS